MLEKLIEQGRAEQSLLQDTLKGMTAHFNERVQQLSQTVDGRLNEISGKVAERLDEGFKKPTNVYFGMSRLAVIDEAQKRSRTGVQCRVAAGNIGRQALARRVREVQLEALVRNSLRPMPMRFNTP